MASILDGLDNNGNIDPKKKNIPNNSNENKVPTAEGNVQEYSDIKERGKELMLEHQSDYLDRVGDAQYGDPTKALQNPNNAVMESQFSESARLAGRDRSIEGEAPAQNLQDIHNTWSGEVGEGFMRGIGQTISSNGDVINFIGSAIPGFSMAEGNLISRYLNSVGDSIEDEHTTYLKKKLEGKEITWASLADSQFWSANVSELIPLALEMIATGGIGAAATKGTVKMFVRRLPKSLLKYGRQTTAGAVELMAGAGQGAIDVIGTGGKIGRHLFRSVDGAAELTQFSKAAVNMIGGGLTNNLLSGAMNGMELHKQMQQANKDLQSQGKEAIYSEEDMAQAAANTFINNTAYMPVDMISWGITYGKVLEKAAASAAKASIRPAAQLMKNASGNFAKTVLPTVKGFLKASGHAVVEGIEEEYQESFEEWAKLKAKASVTGEYVPDYFTFYKSDKNLSTRVLSFAVGGLMGGVSNLRTSFNRSADNALNYYNRNEVLRASIAANDKKGQEFKEFHIHNTMLDLHNEGKEELFDQFMTGMIMDGKINEEQAKEYKKTFEKIGADFEMARGLNIAGKEALMRNTVAANFMQESIQRDVAERDARIADAKIMFSPGPELDQAIQNIVDDYQETMTSKAVVFAHHNQNRLNLISGKKADPMAVEFVVSRNGKENVMLPKFMTHLGYDMAAEQGGIVAGLSEEQYAEYVDKPDEEIYEDAKKMNKKAVSSLSGNLKKFFDSVMPKAPSEENQNGIEEPVAEENMQSGLDEKEQARKDEIEQLLEEDDAAQSENAQPVEEGAEPKEKKPVMSMPERAALEKELDTLNAKERQVSTEPVGGNTEPKSQSTEPTVKNVGRSEKERGAGAKVSESRDVESENDFEKESIDSESEPTGPTLKDKRKEDDAAAEKEFLEQDEQSSPEPKEKTYEVKKTAPDKKTVTVQDSDGNFILDKAGKKPKVFLNERLANNAINELKKQGKASMISRVSRFFKRKKSNPEQEAEATRAQKEKAISNFNKWQDTVRRGIVEQSRSERHPDGRAALNNPSLEMQKNQLDAYLNSSIAKFVYGPNQVQKMVVLNRNLRQKGINLDVISANNLFSTVGIDAVGYTVGASIFIDEKSWEQNEVFMHEMSHINYRLTKDNPETKAVVKYGRGNKALVDRIESDYAIDVLYDFDFGDGVINRKSFRDVFAEQGFSNQESESFDLQQMLEAYGNPKKVADEEQDVINEEIFAFTMEGPLAKQYDQFFEKIKEFGRRKETRGWWAWYKDKSVTYEQSTIDVIESLNNGKNVPRQDLFEHVMKGYQNNIQKSLTTTRGYASRIAKDTAEDRVEQKLITKDKLSQQAKYNAYEMLERYRKSNLDRTIEKIRKEIYAQEKLTPDQQDIAFQNAMEEIEENIMNEGVYDDYEMAKAAVFKGATRVLNNFTKSMNYVKRQRFLKNPNNLAADFDADQLIDRDELISEMFNMAFQTKGNTNKFIQLIEKSPIQEIQMFNKYMDKLYPGEKRMILSSMAYVMSNNQTISGVRSFVNSQGKYEVINALSETEKNRVDSHLRFLEEQRKSGEENNIFERMEKSYANLKAGRGNNQDYLNIIRALSPNGVKYSEVLKSNSINIRGTNAGVKYLVDQFVKSGVAENANGSLYIYNARPFVEAIVDSNRKFTSYSVIENAEGNYEPSKITNNHLLSQVNDMVDYLSQKQNGKTPSFKKFKERFGHIADASKRSINNPVLQNIYDNFTQGKSAPSVTQYLGLKHQQSGMDSLYKNSTDFTQTFEEFMMFANRPNTPEYQQNLGAFADSPRKFLFSVPRLPYAKNFTGSLDLNRDGKRALQNAFNIYQSLNQTATDREGIIENYDDFEKAFQKEVLREFAQWNQYGRDLIENKTMAKYFQTDKTKKDFGKLNQLGKQKITEFVFNQSVNGMALSEIFNPGVPVKEIVKRNKGNSSPVVSFGNKNLKLEPVIVNDEGIKTKSDSGMYILEEDAKKIVAAGLGVFDMNNGLKLLNYSIDRDNPNFSGRSAYFKGYTTIISEETLKTEPGLRGIYELLHQRRAKHSQQFFEKNGTYPSDDLLNGEENYLNFAVPMSAIKSDFITPAQKKMLSTMTYDNLNAALDGELNPGLEVYGKILDSLYYGDNGFMGISGYNFGPQQIMDKVTVESTTPVQFISSLIVNGATQGTLAKAEEIQKLIRMDMTSNMDEVIKELNDMNPQDYKKFILKNLDLENMNQSQRLIIEESLSNLNHTAISDFVVNTLANKLKFSANKLKTAGTIAQQKPSAHYKLPNGYSVNDSTTLNGYTDRRNEDGSVGSNPLEIVLPKHMNKTFSNGKKMIQERTYYTPYNPDLIASISKNKVLTKLYNGTPEERLQAIKSVAQREALNRFGRVDSNRDFGFKIADYIGTVQKDGKTVGYFVRGEMVMATRIPSHGPASTGVFEVIDFLAGEGNQAIVSEKFSETIGSDYDGDALFIQYKSKDTPNFNKALDKTVELWTSPEMYKQIRAKINFEDKVKKVIKNNNVAVDNSFPMSPGYHRDAYNNTMISKRSIGVIFNLHRIANYLAAYNVGLRTPININGQSLAQFSDNATGEESRNNQSAMLANIILDNAKYHYADKLGMNDQTINQFALLINLGVDLKDVSAIMNSDAVKAWVKFKKNNQSPYLKRRRASEIEKMIFNELGIEKSMSASYSIETKDINSPQQKRNIIAVMEMLEKMNTDVLKIGKIMAGHKGIENNPFVLENQINNFNDVVENRNQESTLVFNEAFRNNPDINAYQQNAEKILGIMKKANKIYRTSTAKMMDNLRGKMNFDAMTDDQLQRASEIIEKFVNSRILGLNNISAEQKSKIKQDVFEDLKSYYDSLVDAVDDSGRTAMEKSILFQRAININFGRGNKGNYISANPRFFNESISEEEKRAVQREFAELPVELKDNLIVIDLMQNGLTGPLSLTNVFDQGLNSEISMFAEYDQAMKNDEISKSIMGKLENLIITNEMNSSDGKIPKIFTDKQFNDDTVLDAVKTNPGVYSKLKRGEALYFSVNGQPYNFEGFGANELQRVKRMDSNQRDMHIDGLIKKNLSPYEKFSGDVNLEAISLSDKNTFHPHRTSRSYDTDGKADHIIEANIIEEGKKKTRNNQGRASRIDYHNYNDVRELTREEFDRVMEYKIPVEDEQKQLLYNIYQQQKEEANLVAKKVNQVSVSKMTDDALKEAYAKYAVKDVYAYSIVTTPLIMEIANRASVEQSKITGKYEDGNDVGLISSWLDNNNIGSNHPTTQALVRKINGEYKTFVKERGTYIKKINEATEALYQEKFNLSEIRPLRFLQRMYRSLIADRRNVYDMLYGRLVETNEIKLPGGKVRQEFKFKEKSEIEQMKQEGLLTDAEYNFYNVFREVTAELEPFGSNGKGRRDYIPHTAMNTMEMYSTRGLLGLLVNSKGQDSAIDDVKLTDPETGEQVYFSQIKSVFNARAASGDRGLKTIQEFNALKKKAKKLYKNGVNEDGTAIQFSDMQNMTLLGMSPMSRFAKSRSIKAEEMPSMDLNKALVDYVHSTLFANGNGKFGGFSKMMPLIDGVYAYNEKNGYRNAANYVKEVFKQKFIMKQDQELFGPTADKIVNGLVKSNMLYALGYKGFLLGKGLYAVGNVAIGKYMNIKREGGKAWLQGELRYWGTDQGFGVDSLSRRRRAKNILSNLGFMEIDLYDDVSVEKKSGLDGIFTQLALLPMSVSEHWIQRAHFLGLLSEEEFEKFDEDGNYKEGVMPIEQKRILELEERVKGSHGKGYSPTDQSRIQTYSLGRMFMQFSRHIPSNIRERFAKEDVDVYGNKYVGSLRQMYSTAQDIFNNRMSPEKFRAYYNDLEDHEKQALNSAMRGIAMITLAGFVDASMEDSSDKLSADYMARGVVSDANIHFDPDRMSFKMIPPSIRSTLAVTHNIFGGQSSQPAPEM